MQRPGGGVRGHVSSRCVHRFADGFGLKWPEMDTARNVISRRHHPRKRMIQYSAACLFIAGAGVYWIPAGACPRARLCETRGRGMTVIAPLAFPGLLAPNKDREIGGGRAT